MGRTHTNWNMQTLTKKLSPAELTLKAVQHAQKLEEQKQRAEEWARYEAENRRLRDERLGIKPEKPKKIYEHGTRSRYDQGCRCDPCREKINATARATRAKKRAQMQAGELPNYCGTATGYQYGCRCDNCKAAKRAYVGERSPRPVAQHGTATMYRKGCRCEPCRHSRRNVKHGKPQTYREGCRCLHCTKAWASYQLPLNRERRGTKVERVEAEPYIYHMASKYGDLTGPQYYRLHPEEIPAHVHGTSGGYSNYNCRCDACTEAHSAGLARSKERRLTRPIPHHVHGTSNGYGNYGCRCKPCTKAWSAESVERARRRRARSNA